MWFFNGEGKGRNIMKMMPSEQARRSEDVGVGFTSIGVTVAKLGPFIRYAEKRAETVYFGP